VEEFHYRAKIKEAELDLLFDVSLVARGVKDELPLIPRIEIALSSENSITLPGANWFESEEYLKKSPFYSGFESYKRDKNIPDSIAYKTVKDYVIKLNALVNELEVYNIQSTPRLGRFIIFKLTDKDQVIYAPDVSKVSHEYWGNFFSNEKNKLSANWYYKKQ
jgi:hypothetical protein